MSDITSPARPALTLAPNDRVLVLIPHPDDETIATGGIIQEAVAMGLPIRLVYLTYGDNAETAFIAYRKRPVKAGVSTQAMGLVRHGEALAAAATLGLAPEQVTFLGYPDFLTLKIWAQHWGDAPACESMFTRTRIVPYDNALRPGTPYKGDEILADIETVIREFKPTVIFTSHPGDHNPDHLSLYLFTRVALWNLADELQPSPTLWPFLVHHPKWPRPEGYHPELPMTPPDRLANEVTWHTRALTSAQIETKLQAVQAHQTQLIFDRKLLESFVRSDELFGDFPDLDLRAASAPVASASAAPEIPHQLTRSERAKFVGIEERAIWMDGDRLSASFRFSRPVGDAVLVSGYLFGYRPDVPFSRMPKLRLLFSGAKIALFEQGQELTDAGLEVKTGLRELSFSLPLAALGDPQWLFASAHTSISDVPMDWVAWRTIALPST